MSHGAGDCCVGEQAGHHLLVGYSVAFWINARCHDKPGLFIVFFVFVEDPIKVRELPSKDVDCQQQRGWIHQHACLRKCTDEWRQSSYYGTDECVVNTALLHR